MFLFIMGMLAGAIVLTLAIKAELLLKQKIRQRKYVLREQVVRELRREGWTPRPGPWS